MPEQYHHNYSRAIQTTFVCAPSSVDQSPACPDAAQSSWTVQTACGKLMPGDGSQGDSAIQQHKRGEKWAACSHKSAVERACRKMDAQLVLLLCVALLREVGGMRSRSISSLEAWYAYHDQNPQKWEGYQNLKARIQYLAVEQQRMQTKIMLCLWISNQGQLSGGTQCMPIGLCVPFITFCHWLQLESFQHKLSERTSEESKLKYVLATHKVSEGTVVILV